MARWGLRWGAVPVWLALAGGAAAQTTSALERLASLDAVREWQAVGRLDIGKDAFCTATMITREHVLTAAHCVYDTETGEALNPGALTFRAGLRDGAFLASRTGTAIAVLPSFDPTESDFETFVSRDIAVITLRNPIADLGIDPFPVAETVPSGRAVKVVSYGLGRAAAPSLQDRCNIEASYRGILVFDCDLTFGSSGAAILEVRNGKPRGVSIVSAGQRRADRRVALGPRLGSAVAELLQTLGEGTQSRRIDTRSERRSISEQLARPTVRRGLPQIGD